LFVFCFFEARSYYVFRAGFELVILLLRAGIIDVCHHACMITPNLLQGQAHSFRASYVTPSCYECVLKHVPSVSARNPRCKATEANRHVIRKGMSSEVLSSGTFARAHESGLSGLERQHLRCHLLMLPSLPSSPLLSQMELCNETADWGSQVTRSLSQRSRVNNSDWGSLVTCSRYLTSLELRVLRIFILLSGMKRGPTLKQKMKPIKKGRGEEKK
jgi:hypothetical protein